jgi:hypothetical protein
MRRLNLFGCEVQEWSKERISQTSPQQEHVNDEGSRRFSKEALKSQNELSNVHPEVDS